MSRLSVKTRITLWYTAFFIILVSAVLLFMFSLGRREAREDMGEALMAAAEDALNEIEYEDGALEIDDDIEFFGNGVYVSVYDGAGVLLGGRAPGGFAGDAELADGAPRLHGEWYIYDARQHVPGYGIVWVRAVSAASGAQNAMSTLLRLALIALPGLALLAAAGGYIITKRAFLPVKRITETAERIDGSGDLSARIGLGEGGDEIHTLAAAFDRMFSRLEEAFEKEKRFTADASHELRTPTAVILSESEYGISHPEEAEESLQNIAAQAKKMSAVLSQLLLLARADRREAALQMETLDISELAEMVIMQQREAAEENGISIHGALGEHILIRGDETMLMRFFMNLIENAVRYGKPGGNVWVSLEKQNDRVCGEVRDDGIGIRAENLDRVWERFFQEEPSRGGKGAGLGLSMVKWIAQAHGGSVSVVSRYGAGSSFKFFFPV